MHNNCLLIQRNRYLFPLTETFTIDFIVSIQIYIYIFHDIVVCRIEMNIKNNTQIRPQLFLCF